MTVYLRRASHSPGRSDAGAELGQHHLYNLFGRLKYNQR